MKFFANPLFGFRAVKCLLKVKVKLSRYRPGQAFGVPGG
jgi:hypothetical protein